MPSERVVVVGAGLSGLRTADLLLSSGVKEVVVLEATDRVGGRLFRHDYKQKKEGKEETVAVDLGGQWIGPPQKYVSELVEELKLKTEEQFDVGGAILEMQGDQIKFEGNIGTLQRFGTEELLEKSWETLDKLALSVPISDPYLSPQASEWDNLSLEEWMRINVVSEKEPSAADQVRKLINWFAVVCLCVESSQVSFLYFLWWLHAGGGYQPLVNIKDGAQHYWLPGSAQEIAQKLRERVEKKGGIVVLNAPVIHIQQKQQQNQPVTITYRRGGRYVVVEGEEVVVSVPPAVMNAITFSPPLPGTRAVMHLRMPMGCVIKYVVVYRKPWWREMGLSGTLLSDEGPIGVVYDKSLESENFYSLVCFMTGNTAREWGKRTAEERKDVIVNQFVKAYGTEKARSELVEVLEKDWAEEPYARGCYMCIPSPGGLQGGMDHFRDPFGKIHFVGTETGNVWIGYMDGALESAHRAVKEILSTNNSAKL